MTKVDNFQISEFGMQEELKSRINSLIAQ